MKIKTSTRLGNVNYMFEIEEKNDLETLHTAAVISNMPQYCNECKNNQHFKLDSNKDKEGNVYVNVVCGKCFAKAKLGRYKTGGYFWHKFEKYEKNNQTQNNNQSNNNQQNDDFMNDTNFGNNDNDVPF